MRILICLLFLFFTTSLSYGTSHRDTFYAEVLSNKGIDIVRSSRVETSFPDWFRPGYSEDIDYWLNILPFPEDRDEDRYIVLPKLGLIAPIKKPSSGTTYHNFNYNSYLESGVALYPNNDGDLGSYGNSVIFGHSSNWKHENGRYKTIFSVLPLLNKGDQIWVFKKQFGNFVLYKYQILQSYETHPYDGFVTKASTRKIITLFTCTDIGTTENRWLIKAEQMQGNVYVPYDHNKPKSSIASKINTIKKQVNPGRSTHSINQAALESIFDTIE